jgi:transcriptional regulator CtsR
MRNISDIIENHLKSILQASKDGSVEIQRSEVAELFHCVPSQINYVISTRFTPEKGYIVESKRGGGGYIRIKKVNLNRDRLYSTILEIIGNSITQREAEGLIQRLESEGLVTAREARILMAAVSRDTLRVQVPLRDQLRANLLSSMLVAILNR